MGKKGYDVHCMSNVTSIRTGELRRDLGRVGRLLAAARRAFQGAPPWGAISRRIATAEYELGLLETVAFDLLKTAQDPQGHVLASIDEHVSVAAEALAATGLEFSGDTISLTTAFLECIPSATLPATCEDEGYAFAFREHAATALQKSDAFLSGAVGHGRASSGIVVAGTSFDWLNVPYASARTTGRFDASGMVRRPWFVAPVALGTSAADVPPAWWEGRGWP